VSPETDRACGDVRPAGPAATRGTNAMSGPPRSSGPMPTMDGEHHRPLTPNTLANSIRGHLLGGSRGEALLASLRNNPRLDHRPKRRLPPRPFSSSSLPAVLASWGRGGSNRQIAAYPTSPDEQAAIAGGRAATARPYDSRAFRAAQDLHAHSSASTRHATATPALATPSAPSVADSTSPPQGDKRVLPHRECFPRGLSSKPAHKIRPAHLHLPAAASDDPLYPPGSQRACWWTHPQTPRWKLMGGLSFICVFAC